MRTRGNRSAAHGKRAFPADFFDQSMQNNVLIDFALIPGPGKIVSAYFAAEIRPDSKRELGRERSREY